MARASFPKDLIGGHDVCRVCVAFTMIELDLPENIIGYLGIRPGLNMKSNGLYNRHKLAIFRTIASNS